jgi:GTP-dependent phosphoenolpyruvate carboxykinase
MQKQQQQEQQNINKQNNTFGKHPSLADLYLDETNDDDKRKWKQLFSCKSEEITDFKMRVTDFFNELEKNSPVGVPHELKEQLDKLC